jgi:hypothetical protein
MLKMVCITSEFLHSTFCQTLTDLTVECVRLQLYMTLRPSFPDMACTKYYIYIYIYILIVVFPCMLIITQLLFQQNALVFLLLKAQDITICAFCLCILSPYMFQPAWVIFRGRNVSA